MSVFDMSKAKWEILYSATNTPSTYEIHVNSMGDVFLVKNCDYNKTPLVPIADPETALEWAKKVMDVSCAWSFGQPRHMLTAFDGQGKTIIHKRIAGPPP